MDNPRIYLWIGLALLAWMNVIQWNREYGTPASPPAASPQMPVAGAPPADAGSASQLPAMPAVEQGPAASASTPEAIAAPAPTSPTAARVRVVTDVLDLDISLQGGDLVRADLLEYPRDKREGSPPVRLF